MNKKILVSFGIIGLLLIYIVVSRIDFSSADIRVEKITDPVTRMVIMKSDGSQIALDKKGESWVITPGGYPADTARVKGMVEELTKPSLLKLVSEKGYLTSYDLNKEKVLTVALFSDAKKLFSLGIGRVTPSGRHTFVLYNDSKKVYQREGSLKTRFGLSVNDLRDKVVAIVKPEEVTSMAVRSKGRTWNFSKTSLSEKGKDGKPVTKDQWICKEKEKVKLENGMVMSAVRIFSRLRAKSFFDEKVTPGKVLAQVTLKTGKEYNLTIFQGRKKDSYMAQLKGYPYLFEIEPHVAKKFIIDSPRAFSSVK